MRLALLFSNAASRLSLWGRTLSLSMLKTILRYEQEKEKIEEKKEIIIKREEKEKRREQKRATPYVSPSGSPFFQCRITPFVVGTYFIIHAKDSSSV